MNVTTLNSLRICECWKYWLNSLNLKVATFVRTHNIEHEYFYGLAKSEPHVLKKLFFYSEGWKLKRFEQQLFKVNGIFTISPYEQEHFASIYGKKCEYIPAFHQTKNITNHTKKGDYILYHGDLRVSDNVKAALFLIDVYEDTNYQLIIASSSVNKNVIAAISKFSTIHFKEIKNQEVLENLFENAHINTLLTFQKTGIKLKLLNSLYQGKYIIANNKMINDTGLENLCELANTKKEILQKTELLFAKEFLVSEIKKRQEKLLLFCPTESAKKIVNIIFKQ